MYTIWKYPLSILDTFEIEMPKSAVMLSVQMQNGHPCLWAHVKSDNEKEIRYFELVGTGNEAPRPGQVRDFIGTFQTGPFVFHLFERMGKDE